MKQLILLLLCISISQLANGQNVDTLNANFYTFNVGDNSYYKKVVPVYNGDTILIKADTAYIVNTLRLTLYEQSKNTIINWDHTTVGNLIATYEEKIDLLENSLLLCQNSMNQIGDSVSFALDGVVLNLDNNIRSLRSTEMTLTNAQKTLTTATESLNLAKKQLRREKWMWGLGGSAIGIITGIIIKSIL